jgi:hypothetical protein
MEPDEAVATEYFVLPATQHDILRYMLLAIDSPI